MADRETNVRNFALTTSTVAMAPTDTTLVVESTSDFPPPPCILVIEPDSPERREVVLFDGEFTSTTFQASIASNRYLGGSAAEFGITHPVGSTVLCAPLAQHIEDLNDRVDEVADGLVSDLDDLSDVDVSGRESGDVLAYDGSEWGPSGSYVTTTDIADMVASDEITTIVKLTQAEYDALDPADPDVLYVVVG